MTKDIQIIIWIALGSLFLVNGAFMLYYNLHMRASVKPGKLMMSMFAPLWWLNTEALTGTGQQYRSKYLVHMFIGGVILFGALLLWVFGGLPTNA